ncbi:MAG TPA: hypothetical protein ENK66_07925 [Arcobacter sp.]|nr:hypothetical protein [Arcobacter sp.]
MKKLLLGLVLFVGLMSVASAKHYKCYRYVNGSPTGGHVKVEAYTKSEAVNKALAKYENLGKKVHSVNCHFTSK